MKTTPSYKKWFWKTVKGKPIGDVKWTPPDFAQLSLEWRTDVLKKLPKGAEIKYHGPARGVGHYGYKKVCDTGRMMIVDKYGETRRFAYERLECAEIRTAMEMTNLLLYGEKDPLPF